MELGSDPFNLCPGEREILFPPLSHMEVVGQPRVDMHEGKPVIVVSVDVNINQKALTIEGILSQRKQTLLSVGENLKREIKFDLQIVSESPCSQESLEKYLKICNQRDDSWFNADVNFKDSIIKVLELKEETIAAFVESEKGNLSNEKVSMHAQQIELFL